MIGADKGLRLYAALLVAEICFIWGNSLLPAELSAAISGGLRELLGRFLPGGGDAVVGTGDGMLRKIAHFLEFCALGATAAVLLGRLGKPAVFSLAVGFFVACADECIQIFVPGRGPGLTDVALDTLGAAAGLVLMLGAWHLSGKRNT